MTDKELIAYFKLAHGFFNLCMLALFCYQGWLGLRIRKARLRGGALPFPAIRRHRRMGPTVALGGILGFAAGVAVILLDKGRVMEYPLHFAGGLGVVAVIGALWAVSRRITAAPGPFRDLHFRLGMLLLAFYVLQTILGLSILL